MALIPVVNEQDEIIGYKERSEIQEEDIYRVAALWITNSKGEILITQRAFTKKNSPGVRWTAVAGTVEKWETYEQNIIKEAYEELGIENITITPWFYERKWENRKDIHTFFVQSYRVEINEPIKYFHFPKREIEEIRRISMDELASWVQKHPEQFTPNMQEYLQRSL